MIEPSPPNRSASLGASWILTLSIGIAFVLPGLAVYLVTRPRQQPVPTAALQLADQDEYISPAKSASAD